MISEEDIDRVKSQVNMRMVAEHFGIRINRAHQALCPFHNDKKPSMRIYDGYAVKDGFYCWACGAGGDIFKFVSEYRGISYIDAVKYLAGTFCVDIEDKEVSNDENVHIDFNRWDREIDKKLVSAQRQTLSHLSDEIRWLEMLKSKSVPFGDIYTIISNQLPSLQYQWDWLFEQIYSKDCVVNMSG